MIEMLSNLTKNSRAFVYIQRYHVRTRWEVGWGGAKCPGEAKCPSLLWRHSTWFYSLMCFLNSCCHSLNELLRTPTIWNKIVLCIHAYPTNPLHSANISNERYTLSRDKLLETSQLSIGAKRLLWCATKPSNVGVLPLLTFSVVG